MFSDIAHHDYAALAVVVFLESIGIPVPAAVALIAAGTAAAAHSMRLGPALGVAIAATLLGDLVLFTVGRLSGWWMLAILCRVSLNPETCILRSAEQFHRRGRLTLLFAKFIPGINTMAPPMAGTMRMPFWRFLLSDFAGAALYAGAYAVLGFAFGGVLENLFRRTQAAGHALGVIVVAGLAAYFGYRVFLFWKHRRSDVAPRITVHELAEQARTAPGKLLIADVRSHGYYDRGAVRIAGSERLEPSEILRDPGQLPRDREIYLYCT
ncbi:MAG: VTT domain-containing protein [Acidobacteria bacterium]|nr:VTT domain-containing protein [Acidobacteriota bacterium]